MHSRTPAFARAFVASGGLGAVSTILSTSKNLHLRGQMAEVALQLSDGERVPWYSPPQDAEALRCHEQALSLLKEESPWLAALTRHATEDSFPGGGLICLRVLAWHLSWAREIGCRADRTPLGSP